MAQYQSIRHTHGQLGEGFTVVFDEVAVESDNRFSVNLTLEQAWMLQRALHQALMNSAAWNGLPTASSQHVRSAVGSRVLVTLKEGDLAVSDPIEGRYQGIVNKTHLAILTADGGTRFFHLDKISFEFPDAPESNENRIIALTDGWVI